MTRGAQAEVTSDAIIAYFLHALLMLAPVGREVIFNIPNVRKCEQKCSYMSGSIIIIRKGNVSTNWNHK